MHNILVTPGDGIGPEVMDSTRRVLGWYAQNRNFAFEVSEAPIGGMAYEKFGRSDPDETIAKAKQADAVLFGAVGGPQWDSLPFEKKPERGLLRLRKDLELFANLRPAICFDALKDASTLMRALAPRSASSISLSTSACGNLIGRMPFLKQLP